MMTGNRTDHSRTMRFIDSSGCAWIRAHDQAGRQENSGPAVGGAGPVDRIALHSPGGPARARVRDRGQGGHGELGESMRRRPPRHLSPELLPRP